MTHDPLRTIRLKWDSARDPGRERDRLRAPRRDAQGAAGTPRFLGRIVSGGSIPSTLDKVFLVVPVGIEGDESEGAPASVVGDPSRVIPVVIVGTNAPTVGDVVLVHSIGGRWVAERNGPPPTDVTCFPCNVPRKDLTLSWTNVLTGSGSTPLAFDGSSRWRSGCSGQIVYTLACQSGVLAFSATYFPDGDCPDGPSQACSSAGAAPQGLTVVQTLCDPLVLTYAATSATCPYLVARGYTKFVITH
jgi:hypothetical protein